jgi:hypothetical protein
MDELDFLDISWVELIHDCVGEEFEDEGLA